jgi:hypothetical protein
MEVVTELVWRFPAKRLVQFPSVSGDGSCSTLAEPADFYGFYLVQSLITDRLRIHPLTLRS